ncbi:MAG: hypothetical protein ACYS9X_17500 [Planctomycetota bacterium]
MSKGFSKTVAAALTLKETKYLVLGDTDHGEKSLKCLAAAVAGKDLKPLKKYGVSTVLFEGPRRGQELVHSKGTYKKAVKVLSGSWRLFVGYQVRVLGCEDKQSESTLTALQKLINKPPSNFLALHDDLLDKRMPDANESWVAQMIKFKTKVILCCGTSHLPAFTQSKHAHIGVIGKLSQKGRCFGYAVATSNSPNDHYTPEKGTGRFGMVEAIDAHPKWETF